MVCASRLARELFTSLKCLYAVVDCQTPANWSGLTNELDAENALLLMCVCRRASDSSSGWLDDQYSSVSSRHQLSWPRQQRPGDASPQPGGGDRPRRAPHAITVDETTRHGDRHQGDRHHGCGRQRQQLATLTQPSSLSALVEYVSLSATSRSQ